MTPKGLSGTSMRGFLVALACTGIQAVAVAQGAVAARAPAVPASASAPAAAAGSKAWMAEARRVLDAAAQPAARWNGPRTGPPARAGKYIAVVDEDLRNGGILGV